MAEPVEYWKALARLMELAGHPEPAAVRAEIAGNLPRTHRPPADSTVADWISGRTIPRQSSDLDLFVPALHRLAQARQHPATPRLPSQAQWRSMAKQAKEARRNREAGPVVPPPGSPDASHAQQGWRTDVAGSLAWKLLKPDDEGRAEPLREQAEEVAERLAELYAEIHPSLADDPWHDGNLARRIARRTNQLIHLIQHDADHVLAPGEAAVIALLPFLYQVHRSRTAAELSHVDPTDFELRASADPERRMYEVLLHGHERLVRRAELGDLKDRRNGRREIGWWLFHQWVKQQPGQLEAFLADVGAGGTGLGVVLDPELLSRLLSCVRSRPQELFDTARAEYLREDAFQLDFAGRDFQGVRERLVGPLFAVAHGMAIDITGLSSVIVRHVGIPDPLDPARLLTTVENASWHPRRDGIGLKANCRHPAVVAALTEHSHHLESLLRGIRHGVDPVLRALPVHTQADEVREVDDKGGPVPIGGIIRFRLDEERVQELLMGENLYRDRSLAIRELYQNALDACRYRQARAQARDSFSAYDGRIEFTQGYDEEEGRHYLECRDNGVGMDEITLSEVFSRAGVRFTDLPRFQEERQEWRSRGITIHPNSRFGIGVLSYFMLADEVRVTTCHMDGFEGKLRELTVLISGPGHYFRVRPTSQQGTIGTVVRLYLRDDENAPSCVTELRRLLGIAEFATTAVHGTQNARWEAGVLLPRRSQGLRPHGFAADGQLVSAPCRPARSDGQVVWCERGGGILVDGIFTEARVRRGILADPQDSRRLRGIVVNLTGDSRPKRLSVDRTEILDNDICVTVERLVRDALPALFEPDSTLLKAQWLTEVAGQSPRLADIVTKAAGAAGCELDLNGHRCSLNTAGFFPQDVGIVHRGDSERSELDAALDGPSAFRVYGDPDATTLLWRLLARRPNAELTALTALVPELARASSTVPALPSDALLRSTSTGKWSQRHWFSSRFEQRAEPGHAFDIAQRCGLSYREVLHRLEELGMAAPARPTDDPVVDAVNLILLSNGWGAPGSAIGDLKVWLSTSQLVRPAHLVNAHFELSISVSEAARRLRGFGFTVPELSPLADTPDDRTLCLLSVGLEGEFWLDTDAPVAPAHLVKAHFELGMNVSEAAEQMKAFGFTVPDLGSPAHIPDERTLRLLSRNLDTRWGLSPTEPVPVGHVLHAAAEFKRPVQEVVEELESYGIHLGSDAPHDWPTDVLLQQGAGWGWAADDWSSLRPGETVPPGVLARTAAHQDVPLRDIAEWIRELGFTAPDTLPERPDDADTVILSSKADGKFPWLTDEFTVPVIHVARASINTGLSPEAVASRLRAYGLMPAAASLPAFAERNDEILLSLHHRSRLDRYPLSLGRPVPVRHVILVSTRLGISPRAVVDRLAQYGLTTPLEAAPDKANRFDADLIRIQSGDYDNVLPADDGDRERSEWLAWDRPVPMHHVISVAARLSMEPREVMERLSAYGFQLPDIQPEQLDEADRRLCLAHHDGHRAPACLPLALRQPITDFLTISRVTGMPTSELVERLERLGVDLQRVTDAIRATLPEVPGLVMEDAKVRSS
ncbi:hypothetical protein GCM10022403_038300 [Streptomyces coacervatus]|uniref:ATP-binding protein n=1 Tax=Streptomyces coacervatus TaxID=647381 RepID=A0ABP7HNH6_9ACTN|nr:hypothetical protein [Streptomyces coacervatus]MDF2270758.1 hypothetical protein [Streptomyces coacervatus]